MTPGPWCAQNPNTRDVVGLVGGAYALLTILRKKMVECYIIGKPEHGTFRICNKISFMLRVSQHGHGESNELEKDMEKTVTA